MIKTDLPEIWNAVAYLRLSKDDRDRDESNSIKNQRDLIVDFVSRNPDIRLIKVVSDDGATGANFNRDAFKEMIRLIESGEATAIITKDFSRLGRDHIETGKYIERYFASKNVRYIAINENYDSLYTDMSDSTNSLIVPFKNIINEAFLEDISTKTKTQLEIKRKNGEFVSNYAVFGYVKVGKSLVVDDFAADIVRTIFERKLRGFSEQQTADALNARGVPSPAEYKKASGVRFQTPFGVNGKPLWTLNAVRRILKNRVYIGVLEQGKRTKASYRMTKYFYKPKEAWCVHDDHHESIVTRHDFELVQELMAKDMRVSGLTGQLHMFSGFVVCGTCGQPMIVKTVIKDEISYVNYICSTHKKFGTCWNNIISAVEIERCVLTSIRQQIAGLLSFEGLTDGIMLDELRGRKQAAIEGMIEKALTQIKEYNDYLVKSYGHFVDGVVTENEYLMFRDSFRRQIEDAERSIDNMRAEIARLGDDTQALELIESFKKHGNITELDRRAVVGLISAVVVHEGRRLEIHFRYSSGFDIPTEFTDRDTTIAEERAVV